MNIINTDIQSIMIKFLKVNELEKIKNINKNFHHNLILNKKTINDMIKLEIFIRNKRYLFCTLSEDITNILLIKYNDINNIKEHFHNYKGILRDIYNLIITRQFDPYKKYAKNFVYIDMILIKTLSSLYNSNHQEFVLFINDFLIRSIGDPKINLFILLSTKRMLYSCSTVFYFNNNTKLYEYRP